MRVLIDCKIQKIHVIDTINSIYENRTQRHLMHRHPIEYKLQKIFQ